MRPEADGRYLEALRFSHTPYFRVDVHDSSGGILYGGLPFTDGTVSADRGSDCRYTLGLTVPIAALPFESADLLAPFGNRLAVYSGLTYPDGSTAVIPVGLYRIEDVSGDMDRGPISINAKGLEAAIIDDKFTAPRNFPATTDLVSTVTALIQETLPTAAVTSLVSGSPTIATKTWDADSGRWDAIKEMAASVGCEVYADAVGAFTIAPIPDIDTATVDWDVEAGEGGVLVKEVWNTTRDGVYNAVLAVGENTSDNSAPTSSLVTDTDIASATYYGGPFGKRPFRYSSSLITSSGQAQVVAIAKLRDLRAPNTSVDLSAIPNAGLEPGDCLRVVSGNGMTDLHLVQSLSLALTEDGDFPIKTISRKALTADG